MSRDLVDSGNEYLGRVPRHWEVSRFGRHMRLNGGQVDPRSEPWAGMILVAPNHVESGTGRIIGRESARDQGADSGKYLASRGQILYSKIRPALNKVAIAQEACLCSADMYAMSSLHHEDDTQYLMYFMLSRPFHTYMTQLSMRVKMPKVNREELGTAPWLRPPAAEQRVIAEYLDHETAQIDALVAKQEALIRHLEERRLAVITTTALTGLRGEGPGERDVTRWGSSLAVEPWLVRAPRTWGMERFKTVCLPREERNVAGTELMLSLTVKGHLTDRSTMAVQQNASDTSIPRYFVARPNDLVVNPMWLIGGAIGVSDKRGAVSPDYRVFEVNERLDPWYLHAVLRSAPYFDQYKLYTRSNTTFDRRIKQNDLDNLPLPIPPLGEQRAIVEYIGEQTGRIDTLIAKAEEHIALAKERRSALITAAVTGQVDVRTARKAS